MKKQNVLSLVLALAVMFTVSAFAASFTDVSNHWAESSINKMADDGIIKGYESGDFKPENNVTHAELATIINRILGITASKDVKNTYTDVNSGDWFYTDVMALKEADVLDEAKKFSPDTYATREEVFVMINKVLNLEGTASDLEKFTDYKKVSSSDKTAFAALITNGYVNGYPDGTLKPQDKITRAELAKVLDKACGMIIRTAGTYDISKVSGCVIVTSANVKLTGKNTNGNVVVLTSKMKSSLKTDVKDVTVIFEETTTTKKSSSGSGSSSSSVVSRITLTTATNASGEEYYKVSRNSYDVKDGRKLVVTIDGTQVVSTTVSSSNLKDTLVKIANAMDASKTAFAVVEAFTKNDNVLELAQDTYKALGTEDQGLIAVALLVPEVANSDTVKSAALKYALENELVSAETIKSTALTVIADEYDFAKAVAALNSIGK